VRREFLHFARPQLTENEISAVVDALRSGWLTTAGRAREFEKAFGKYVHAEHAVALNSCTAGLFLSMKVLGIGPGDEVITTPFTFAATVNTIEHTGAKPVLVDIQPDSGNIEPALVEKAISPRTKAIMPVHVAGRPCDMDSLLRIAREKGLYIVQDCAHAIESEWRATNVGSLGDLACYSFYATKNVTTGEGGMVTTGRQDWADRLRTLALHGLDKTAYDRYAAGGQAHYDLKEPGYKFNMPDTAAALGNEGLKLIEERHKRRSDIWNRYRDELGDLPGLGMPPRPEPDTRHAYHLFICTIEPSPELDRDRMIECLGAENIGTGIHFAPVHFFSYYRNKYHINREDLPNATWLGERVFSLPLTPFLSDQDVDDVVRAVRKIVLYHCEKHR